MLSKEVSSTIFKSLVWLGLELNPGLPDHWWTLYPLSQWAGRDKKVHSFLKGIRPKVNVIGSLEFKLAYFEVAVQYFSHYATGTRSFGNVRHNSAAPYAFAAVVKVTNHSELWDSELAWYSPLLLAVFASIAGSVASEPTDLDLLDLTWSSSFLQPEWSVFNNLVTVFWSTVTSFFTQEMFLEASAALWLSSIS